MIPCICIDDSKRPKEIPPNKWVKKGEEYHVIYTVYSITSKEMGVHLYEIELDDTCAPYEFYALRRFAFTEENLRKLIELIKDCNDTAFSMDELLKQTELIPDEV